MNILRNLFKPLKKNPPPTGKVVFPHDVADWEKKIIEEVKPFTMTSSERLLHLIRSVEYIVQNKIPGAMVECGVWRGGSMMLTAKILQTLGATDRDLYLYDTFDGMTEPTDADKRYDGKSAESILKEKPKSEQDVYWAFATIEEVKRNISSLNYPQEKIHFVKGPVETTIPAQSPKAIALLRLDTDWYESTKHELIHLYPLLSQDGVIIIDDYGWWQGARTAVDEFTAGMTPRPLLHRIDDTCRSWVKHSKTV